MSDEPREDEDGGADGGGKRERKTRSDKGKPRGGSGRKHVSTRFQRRAEKATETVRELVRLRMPELDVSGLSFSEIVDRDAEAWGEFFAQLGEWFVPFGAFLDLVFGAALVRVLRMAPSFRAGRRELAVRREQRRAERAEREEAEELADRLAADREHARTSGVFEPDPELPPEMTREEWLASGGGAGG